MAEKGERSVKTMVDDLKNVEFETSEEVDVTPAFDSLGLREELLRGIYAYGQSVTLCLVQTIALYAPLGVK